MNKIYTVLALIILALACLIGAELAHSQTQVTLTNADIGLLQAQMQATENDYNVKSAAAASDNADMQTQLAGMAQDNVVIASANSVITSYYEAQQNQMNQDNSVNMDVNPTVAPITP